MPAAAEALARLRAGNHRFLTAGPTTLADPARRAALVTGQTPFAIILGCSDSRVPAELVFDQGFGDLFVIRVAGNIVAPSQVGSVEFAAARFGTRLAVVLGHSQCGAVSATIDALQGRATSASPFLRAIVDRVRPAVETLLAADPAAEPDALLPAAVRANVRASAHQLRHGSALLEGLIRTDGFHVVGAEYSLETGRVDFLDDVPGD